MTNLYCNTYNDYFSVKKNNPQTYTLSLGRDLQRTKFYKLKTCGPIFIVQHCCIIQLLKTHII